jgi:subtilisin family serine protease
VDGKNPNPDIRPDSTVHSYGCNAQLGCPGPRDLEPASDALKAAGVAMIVAGHNLGPSCSSISRQPCYFKSVFTVGALDFKSNTIAAYSGRGPITFDGSNRRKPDISAPGSNVMSAMVGNRYTALSGTSMATPAVAGAYAVFWSACPKLKRKLDQTHQFFEKSALHQTSTQCSSNGTPNNVYGHGTIDVYKAYQMAKSQGFC